MGDSLTWKACWVRLVVCVLVAGAFASCRWRSRMQWRDGAFTSAGCNFVPQDATSQQLSRNDAKGELIGRIRATGIEVRVQPVRVGSYSRYILRLNAHGGANGSAELLGGGKNRFAVVTRKGEVQAAREVPEQLPKDWVCLLSMEGNICLMAWNRVNGGPNPKFHARSAKRKDAVYKVLELDDPRYHHDGVPLKELRE